MLAKRVYLQIWLGCAAMAVLAACIPVPSAEPVSQPVQPDVLGLGDKPAPLIEADWWKSFGDPQVDRMVTQLLSGNPTLQGARARIRAAQAQLAVVRAEGMPHVTLDGQVLHSRLSDAFVIPAPLGGSWRWLGDVQTHLAWSLDFWGLQAARIEKARMTARAAALDAAAARLALAGSFAQTYIGLWLAHQNAELAHKTVEDRQSILNLTQSRVSAGLENESALEQARALLAQARSDALAFEAMREAQVHALAALTGQGAKAYETISRPQVMLDSALPLPSSLPADLLARRPDVLAAKARIEAAAQGRQEAEAAFYPNIDLTAALGFQALGLDRLFTGDALTAGIGPAIHLPIFDAGRLRARHAGAAADLDAAIADYNATVLGAVRQTADALTLIRNLEARRKEQQAVLDSANRAFRLAEERYRLGLSGQVPVLMAEGLMAQARQDMAALLAQSVTQRVTLLLAVGGGFDPAETAQIVKREETP